MLLFKKIKEDYLESRFSEYEGFFEWFFKRKLGFWGKIVFAYTLWAIWMFVFTHPIYMVYLVYVVIVVSLIVVIVEIYDNFKNKNKS